MKNEKLDQLQKMYVEGLITESELKLKREKVISEMLDSDNEVADEATNVETKPEKKHRVRNGFIIFIACFLWLGFICTMCDDGTSAESVPVEKTEEQIRAEEAAKVEKARKEEEKERERKANKVGKWIEYSNKESVKIVSVEKTTYVSLEGYKAIAPEGTHYLCVKLATKNISDRPIESYGKQTVTVISPGGRKYMRDDEITSLLNAKKLEGQLGALFGGRIGDFYLNEGETDKIEYGFKISDKEINDSDWKILIDGKIEVPFIIK